MKIAYIHQYFKLPTENGSTRSYDISNIFIKNNHSVHIYTTSSNKQIFNNKRFIIKNIDNITIYYLYLPYNNSFTYKKRIVTFLKFSYFVTSKIINKKYDIVLASSTPLTVGIPALLKFFFDRTPFLLEIRDVWPEAAIAVGAIKNKVLIIFLYWFEKILYRYSHFIIPLSIDMKNSIIKRYPQFLTKCPFVIENISEINRFQKRDNDSNFLIKNGIYNRPRFSLLYAGSFGYVNNIDYLVKMAELTYNLDQSIIYILVGEGAYKNVCINNARLKGILNKNIYFIEPISKNELSDLYSECTVGSSFVNNIEELWGNSANKFFDCLAAGRPILINHGGWQMEIIKKYNLGFVMPPIMTEQSIQEFIHYTYDEKQILEQSSNALKFAIDNYSLQVVENKYIKLINQINANNN